MPSPADDHPTVDHPSVDHPALTALSLALHQLAESLGDVRVEDIEVTRLEAVTWPDSCLGLPERGEGCARALHPGYRIQLGEGYVFHADQKGNVRRDRSFPRPPGEDPDVQEPDTGQGSTDPVAIGPGADPDYQRVVTRLRYSVEGGIAGGRTSLETDSTQLSPEEVEELTRLITESDFFNVTTPERVSIVHDGMTTRLWIAVNRRNHEVVRGDGIEVEDSPALQALFAWAGERTPPMFPRSAMDIDGGTPS